MTQLLRALIACLLAAAFAAPTAAQPTGTALLLDNARIIVGDGSSIERGAIAIEQGRIVRVGRAGEVTAPPDATRIDLTGKTVMPALVNPHLHLGYEGYTSWSVDNYTRANLEEHLNRLAYYGVAAVISTGTDPTAMALELERDQRAGRVGGARFLFAAGAAPPNGGPNDNFLRMIQASGRPILYDLVDARGAREVAGELATQGVRFVKIWVDDRNGQQVKLSPDVYGPFIDEAHRHGIKVFAHPQSAADAKTLVQAGIDGLLHLRTGLELDDEAIRLMRERNVFVTPVLGLGESRSERVFEDPFLVATTPPAVLRRLADAFAQRPTPSAAAAASAAQRQETMRAAFAKLIAADVHIVLGTDSGGLPDHFFGWAEHQELEVFVKMGMTPSQAIVAGTSRPAAHAGLTDLGSIAVGKSADLLVLDANPLEDIRHTQRIAAVYLRGQALPREQLRAPWAEDRR